MTLHKETQATKIERQDDGRLKVHLTTGKCIDNVDTLIFAVGRSPYTTALNAAKAVRVVASNEAYTQLFRA